MTEPKPRQTAKRSIALIGLRGSGKTSVGRELATLLGEDHVDTDDIIAERAGQPIAGIFEAEGEEGFRKREREAIAQVVQNPPEVISVGGGAVVDEQNARLLKSAATIVWLTAPVEVLWRRIADDPDAASSRPALTDRPGLEELEHLSAARAPLYKRIADFTINTNDRAPRDLAAEIAGFLKRK